MKRMTGIDMKKKNDWRPSAARGKFGRACSLMIVALALAFLLPFGCAPVGPNYVKPDMEADGEWNSPLNDGLIDAPPAPDTMARWWESLNDPVLSNLMSLSLDGSLDLREARSRVREARARRGISEADLFPAVDASGSYSHGKSSENAGSGSESHMYSAGFDAGWEIDVFGGVRRSIEAADANLEASREDFYGVLVSLFGEIAFNYIEARTYQTRIRVAEGNIGIQEETYDLTRSRFEAGLIGELAVQQALYNLESTRARIPALRSGLEASKNRLAVLVGERPGAVHKMMQESKPIPVPPLSVAVGTPAETLRNRPDIKQAERLLAAQSANIGVALAELYPKFRLSGSIGLDSIHSKRLFNYDSHSWNIAPGVSWNVFDAGAIRRNIEVQTAVEEQLLARYETTILEALEEVENALVAYAEEQLRREHLIAAREAAHKAMLLSKDRFMAGLVDFSDVLIAQASLLSFEDQLAESDGTVTSNFIKLYKALGGGWQSFLTEDEKEQYGK